VSEMYKSTSRFKFVVIQVPVGSKLDEIGRIVTAVAKRG